MVGQGPKVLDSGGSGGILCGYVSSPTDGWQGRQCDWLIGLTDRWILSIYNWLFHPESARQVPCLPT